MAHEVESFVSANVSAWHQLGTVLDHTFSAEEAMAEARLGGWNVRKLQEYVFTEDGSRLEVPNRYAIVRDSPIRNGRVDVLGSAGPGYHVIQNEQHADLLNTIVSESGAHFETAGSLKGGRLVFVTMKLPEHLKIGGVDRVDSYLAAVNSHDASTKFTVMVTPIRVVCANTLNAAFRNHSHMVSVRHTRNSASALVGEARRMLDMSFSYLGDFQKQAEEMINTTMSQIRFEELVMREFGPKEDTDVKAQTRAQNRSDEMIELFTDAYTQAGIRDTAWAGFNALTEWYDHQSPVRGSDRSTTRATKSVLDPTFKNQALKLILQSS